jgi:two-component system sensor histidine kinase ComP
MFVAVYLGYGNFHQPYIGIITKQTAPGTYVIAKVDSMGWAVGESIRSGDRLVSVDGTDPANNPIVAKFDKLEQIHEFEIEGPGGIRRLTVPDRLASQEMKYQFVIPVIIYGIFLFMPVFVLIKKRGDPSAQVLTLFLLAAALAYMGAWANSRKDMFGSFFFTLTFLNVPTLFIHFLMQYLQRYELNIFSGRHLAWLYRINVLLLLFSMSYFVAPIHLWIDFSYCTLLTLTVFACQTMLMLILLISIYFRYRQTEYNQILKYFLAANVLAFSPFILAFALPLLLLGHELIPSPIAAMFLFFLPVTFIYMTFAVRFYDIDFIIGRLRYYSLLAVFPAALIVYLQRQIFYAESPLYIRWIQSFFIVYLGIVFLLYMKELLDSRLRRRLFKPRSDFQARLERFTSQISRAMKAEELENMLLREVSEVVAVKQLALVEMNVARYTVSIRQALGPAPGERLMAELRDEIRDYQAGDMIEPDTGLGVVVGKRQSSYYVLWVGEKTNWTRFNLDEKTWLRTIAKYTSMVYDNLQLVAGVVENLEHDIHQAMHVPAWILRLLFSLSEKERRNLAADLHDSALQEQILWYRRLEELSNDSRLSGDLLEEVVRIKEGLLDVIHEIRETCNELRPPFLKELGLVRALENLFEYAQLRTDYTVTFNQEGFHAHVNDEQLLALYRIVQELLRNATKHAHATQVHIELSSADGRIVFRYRDNGIGMDVEDIQGTFRNMGLSGIRERVAALEGEIAFETSPGHGFGVHISLPTETTRQEVLETTIQAAYG